MGTHAEVRDTQHVQMQKSPETDCNMSVGRASRKHTQCQQAGARPRRLGRDIVEFSVKGPVSVSLDEEQVTTPGCSVIDLLFPAPSQVGELVFRNYYTSRVTVLIRSGVGLKAVGGSNKGSEDAGPWTVAIPQRVLMPNPHLEPGSHDLFSIPATESIQEWNNLVAMRLVLRQPSPLWRTFHVEELNVYRDLPRRIPRPVQHTHSAGSPVHCQDYSSLLALIQRQTLETLKWMPGSDQNSTRENHSTPGYEFFNLPQ